MPRPQTQTAGMQAILSVQACRWCWLWGLLYSCMYYPLVLCALSMHVHACVLCASMCDGATCSPRMHMYTCDVLSMHAYVHM